MDYLDRVSLDTPLRIFIRDLWFRQSQEENCQSKKATVFKTLLSNGCDYYELLALYSNFPLTPDDGEILGEYAPIPTHTFPVSLKNIRFALPHWTPSRYHTAPISKVLEEIQDARFARALELLRNPDIALSAIADRSGWPSSLMLSRYVRKRLNQTLTQLRAAERHNSTAATACAPRTTRKTTESRAPSF